MRDAPPVRPAPKDWRQVDYEAHRARHRQKYLAWLAERDLPGTPRTLLAGGWVSDES